MKKTVDLKLSKLQIMCCNIRKLANLKEYKGRCICHVIKKLISKLRNLSTTLSFQQAQITSSVHVTVDSSDKREGGGGGCVFAKHSANVSVVLYHIKIAAYAHNILESIMTTFI